MAWTNLPTNYTDAVWSGKKKYNQINNSDGTVSFDDVTEYSQKQNSFFGANDANQMNAGINTLMGKSNTIDRSLNALWKLNEGVSYQFETDSDAAYSKTVPTGAKLADIQMIGGKSVVWNQLVSDDIRTYESVRNSVKISIDDGSIKVERNASYLGGVVSVCSNINATHKYYISASLKTLDEEIACSIGFHSTDGTVSGNAKGDCFSTNFEKISMITSPNNVGDTLCVRTGNGATDFNKSKGWAKNIMCIDLTVMFGEGNEPSTVAEFEDMFPEDYYPYNAGEIISADVDKICFRTIPDILSSKQLQYIEQNASTLFNNLNIIMYYSPTKKMSVFAPTQRSSYSIVRISETGGVENQTETEYYADVIYKTGIRENWIPLYSNNGYWKKYFILSEQSVPSSVKSLTGYGWGLNGTCYNYVDWENKQFVQKVGKRNYTAGDVSGATMLTDGINTYYELATPVITDISDLLDPIEVESGGTLTFHQTDDTKHIPVPNSVQYVVKLSEVGETA